MTLRRVVALAQVLTMILLLALGPRPFGPALVRAAVAPAHPDQADVFDAVGRGIGCEVGKRRYKGPGLPKDPPWPPGAEPTPEPTPEPSPVPTPSSQPDLSTEPTADGPSALLAADGIRVAQAELASEPTPPPDVTDADISPDVTPAPLTHVGRKLIPGIDVSHHNGDIDYAKVRAAGNRFVYIKATQDIDFVDSMFTTNLARARAAGLAAGAYHFFDYTLDGKAQADHFLDRVEAAGGIDDALPPVVDVECYPPIGSSIHAVAAARLRDFVERIYERTGRMPMVYASAHSWQEVVGDAEGFEGLPLWAACWGCDAPPLLASGWGGWTFWQTGVSRIPGVGQLDGNYFSGKKKDLEAMKLRPLTMAAGAPATASETVELDLGGRDATHLRTSPDGETWSRWQRIHSAATVELPAGEGEKEVFVQLRNGPGLKSPVYRDSILLDRTAPELSEVHVSLREAPLGTGPAIVPVSVRWEARDAQAGLSDAAVSVSCGDSRNARSEAPGSAAPAELASWDAAAELFADATCEVTAIARDGAGNSSRSTTSGVTTATVTGTGGAVLSAIVEGDQLGVIARRGPDAGRASISIDGQAVVLLDLYAPTASGPEVVYVADLGPAARHSVSVAAAGASAPDSTGTGIVIDGFVTLAREGQG